MGIVKEKKSIDWTEKKRINRLGTDFVSCKRTTFGGWQTERSERERRKGERRGEERKKERKEKKARGRCRS